MSWVFDQRAIANAIYYFKYIGNLKFSLVENQTQSVHGQHYFESMSSVHVFWTAKQVLCAVRERGYPWNTQPSQYPRGSGIEMRIPWPPLPLFCTKNRLLCYMSEYEHISHVLHISIIQKVGLGHFILANKSPWSDLNDNEKWGMRQKIKIFRHRSREISIFS